MTDVFATHDPRFIIRLAVPEDSALIYTFIRELAQYEKLEDQVVCTEQSLYQSLFVKHQAQALIGECDGQPVGFALFFENFSTFLGKAGLYLEDLYVKSQFRGRGYGTAFFAVLAQIANERGCQRLDWWCLDWNKPSIDFYLRMGAVPMSEWTVYRLSGETLKNLPAALAAKR